MKLNTYKERINSGQLDRDENVFLFESIFGDRYRKELMEMNKHDIIARIAEMLGPSPNELGKAEMIFNQVKYVIANYIIHHEYNSPKGVSTDLVAWLDSQTNPDKSKRLNKFISKFLK
jgi:hypothetical protein